MQAGAIYQESTFLSSATAHKTKNRRTALERFCLKGEKLIPEELKTATANDIMMKNPMMLHHESTVREALKPFKSTEFRVLPGIDGKACVAGVVNLEDLGYVDVRRQEIGLSETVMHKPKLIDGETSLEHVAQLMIETQQDHVFVIDKEEKLIGVISGIDVVKKILELLSS